jgi:hypothetical protein
MAKAYLAEHRELMVDARATVERWTLEGVFGKTNAKRAKINHFCVANIRCEMTTDWICTSKY